jgi:hypothetical protein
VRHTRKKRKVSGKEKDPDIIIQTLRIADMKKKRRHSNLFSYLYLRVKYSFLGKFLYGPAPAAGKNKGFILIQIDGISYSSFLRAMEKGYVPNIRRLVNKKGFSLFPYYCPMPSNTPYIQSGLMYGNNSGVLGFRWMEKKKGMSVTFKEAASAARIEEEVSEGRTGILKGGSSYLNLFTGGAERSVFTLSTFATKNIFRKKKIGQLDIFLLFMLYVTNLVRTVAYIFIDIFLEFAEWFTLSLFNKRRRREGIFPLIRLINNVIFREIETAGAMTDIVRGVPSIHLTFNGYDEISHHTGPEFPGSFRVLRGIDRKIRKILRATDSCKTREYDVYIFSDHGQTPSTPFTYKYGETLSGLVQRATPEDLEISEFNAPQEAVLYEGWKYMEELKFLTLNLPRYTYNLFERFRGWALAREPETVPFIWKEEKEQVFVNDSGPLSQIYFNFRKEKIALEEIRNKYPELMDSLMEHPGIGVVAGCSPDGKAMIMKWDNNLTKGDRELFITLAEAENSGDIIVQGTFNGEEIINFEEQLSGHGGVGGEQNRPFFIIPPECSLDLSRINNPVDLYPFFFENYTIHVGPEVSDEI